MIRHPKCPFKHAANENFQCPACLELTVESLATVVAELQRRLDMLEGTTPAPTEAEG